MKSSDDLAQEASVENHKKAATALRRLSGGIETQLKSANFYGLSEKERDVLVKALSVLNTMARTRELAKSKKGKSDMQRIARTKTAQKLMANTFSSLSSIEDQVALIHSVHPYMLIDFIKHDQNMEDLQEYFKDVLDSISYRVAQKPENEIKEQLGELWEKFILKKSEYILSHQDIIRKLNSQKQ